ncbi:hypothetical protein [Nonomuraea sp. GTA35]|uniref:hypothetical protein n=1 Tax=Nonomuraea sp. GTA35 TaxID=1676746 RepID=UPI0035C20C90
MLVMSKRARTDSHTELAAGTVRELAGPGAAFSRLPDGRLDQQFFGPHICRRTCFAGDRTGRAVLQPLVRKSEGIPCGNAASHGGAARRRRTLHGRLRPRTSGALHSRPGRTGLLHRDHPRQGRTARRDIP